MPKPVAKTISETVGGPHELLLALFDNQLRTRVKRATEYAIWINVYQRSRRHAVLNEDTLREEFEDFFGGLE